MQIDYALILSAGLGTRMGEIGKRIPKVLWPVFGVKLIDLQILYCRKLGVKKIYINTHFLAEKIKKHVEKNYKNDVELLFEDPLLDSGGAVHNLASKIGYRGNLLTVNGDQLYLFKEDEISTALKKLNNARAVLFSLNVKKGSTYNETVSKDGCLVEICSPNKNDDYLTFSGVGLIKLDGLRPVPGISKFFTTVCNFKEERVALYQPLEAEYWDFGTLEIYFKSHQKIYDLKEGHSLIINFLNEAGIRGAGFDNFFSKSTNSVRLEIESSFRSDSVVSEEISCKVN